MAAPNASEAASARARISSASAVPGPSVRARAKPGRPSRSSASAATARTAALGVPVRLGATMSRAAAGRPWASRRWAMASRAGSEARSRATSRPWPRTSPAQAAALGLSLPALSARVAAAVNLARAAGRLAAASSNRASAPGRSPASASASPARAQFDLRRAAPLGPGGDREVGREREGRRADQLAEPRLRDQRLDRDGGWAGGERSEERRCLARIPQRGEQPRFGEGYLRRGRKARAGDEIEHTPRLGHPARVEQRSDQRGTDESAEISRQRGEGGLDRGGLVRQPPGERLP